MERLFVWAAVITVLLLGSACRPSAEPEPPTQDLLLPLGPLPSSWELTGPPRPMGPHIGFGDEDDSYIKFKLKDDIYNISYHFVLYEPSIRKAEAEYDKLSRSRFNDGSIAIDKPWETPAELSYTSSHADQFRVACTINNIAGQKQVCKMMARYGQYITIFHSVIRPETMSLQEFNGVVKFIDEMMVRELQT